MGQVIWITGSAAVVAAVWAITSSGAERPAELASASVTSKPLVAEETPGFGSSGSALATAAFGMSALQPETYNGELVNGLIKASHLEPDEKLKLQGDLLAAEAGEIKLSDVLTNVRVALSIE